MAVFAGSQTAIFIRAVAEESRRGLKPPGKGLAGIGFVMLRTISNFTYEMVDNQSETARTAVSGSIGMDAVASGSFGFRALPISLVKSDWKLQQKTVSPPAPFPAALALFGFSPPQCP